MNRIINFFILSCLISLSALAGGNQTIPTFERAKSELNKIYADHRITFYCHANFNQKGFIELPVGFVTPKYANRLNWKEWEHIVPAENFGRTFIEWREGDDKCVKKGKPFKGRKCAKTNPEFALMEADMYNLVPAIGSVNAMRSNYNYTELGSGTPNTFGTCPMKIDGKQVEPPPYTRGQIARTYFYFEEEYERFRISDKMKRLLTVWDKQYPVDKWECERAKRIEKVQGNTNNIVKSRCEALAIF